MKKIIIKGEDLARIPLWKTLGKPKDDEEIVLYQLEDGESFPVEKLVSPTEPTFTQKQILQLVREELQEAFEDDYAPEELKDKIYTVHGYIIGAIRRGEVRS